MNIVDVPLADIEEAPFNYNLHPQNQIDELRGSLEEFGQFKNIVLWKGYCIAGNGLTFAARSMGWESLKSIVRDDLTEEQAKRLCVADNATPYLAMPDSQKLENLLKSLPSFDDIPGVNEDWLNTLDLSFDSLLYTPDAGLDDPAADEVPEVEEAITKIDDLWQLGDHRLLCGDATKREDVARLMNGETVSLLHADPPYGMGKEKDGVLNDNLYREKLDAFQMQWWAAFRPSVKDNGSAYIWGNAEDLWRLWYCGGLRDSGRLTFRNEIVWAKGHGQGMGVEEFRSFAPETERCLFFMLGEQGFNNNADNYWEGWEGIRAALEEDCKKLGWGAKDIERICGVGMYTHWFTKSQWGFIPEEHYKKLQISAQNDAFKREYDDLKREYDDLKREYDDLKREWYATRAYFNNTHELMTDVWHYDRVQGEERHGHATPKPVDMMSRAVKSSSRKDDIVAEPFGGSGSTLIACEKTGRKCFMMELDPHYCTVIIKRWEQYTGKQAVLLQ